MALTSATGANAALTGLVSVCTHTAMHTASPGTTGANENANSGSYGRQATSWNTPASSAVTNSNSLTFSTGGTVAVTHVGEWSSATYGAGNFAIGAALGASVTAASITIAAGAISLSAS